MTVTREQAAALRLVPVGRLAPTPKTWKAPLPPLLVARVPDARRREHENLVRRWEELHAQVVELAEQLERQAREDEQALRQAVTKGRKPPAPKAPALEERLAESRRALDAAGEMLTESGRSLVSELTDGDLLAVSDEADKQSRRIVEDLPERVAALLGDLHRSGELFSETVWIHRMLEARTQTPWTGPRSTAGSHRLAQVREALATAKALAEEELAVVELRDHPPQHHPPARGFAPEPGTWQSSTGMPRVVDPEGMLVERQPKPPE